MGAFSNPFARRADIPNFTTMFGNLGKSWTAPLPDDSFLKGVAKTIRTDFSVIGNPALAGLQTLHSYTLPARSLRNNNDYLIIETSGRYSGTANLKANALSFQGIFFVNTGLRALNSASWRCRAELYRITPTQLRYSATIWMGHFGVTSATVADSNGGLGGFNFNFVSNPTDLAVADLDVNNSVITVAASSGAAAAGDVDCVVTKIELVRF